MPSDEDFTIASLLQQWHLSGVRAVFVDQSGELLFGDWRLSIKTSDVCRNQPTLTRGLPWIPEECSRRWLGDRLFFFPDGVPSPRRISIATSRLRQRLDLETWWFDLLRTVVLQCELESEAVVVATTTAASDAVSRAAQLFCRPVIRFEINLLSQGNSLRDLAEWYRVCRSLVPAREPTEPSQLHSVFNVLVSPTIPASEDGGRLQLSHQKSSEFPLKEFSHIPLGDRILFAAANRLHILSCRDNGNVASLVNLHLSDADRSDTPVLIAADADMQLPTAVADLSDGWVPWLLEPINPETAIHRDGSETLLDTRRTGRPSSRKDRTSCPLSDPEDWLLHWTRAQAGPWPGESSEEYLDALILQTASAERSAMASLLRIISDRRLLASSEGIRGRHSVVAFTEVPLREFRERRIFRRHRHRYDFEPWGVAIRKTDLQQAGARPVTYGESPHWKTLTPEEQPYFQKVSFGGATNNYAEREWRKVGDVNLLQFSKESVFIFVDNQTAANLVSRYSRWPVIVVPEDTTSPKLC